MDAEEPDAALVIRIALNKKNEAAMKTGHLEIMSTLVRLCTPNPQGNVPFEPVRDKLVDLYGSTVDRRRLDPQVVEAVQTRGDSLFFS